MTWQSRTALDFRRLGVIGIALLVVGLVVATLVLRGSAQASSAQAPPADEGLLVASVVDDGAAEEAGLLRGDILVSINNQPVNNIADLVRVLDGQDPGDQVTLTVWHGDVQRTVNATLSARNGKAYLGMVPYQAPVLAASGDHMELSGWPALPAGVLTRTFDLELHQPGVFSDTLEFAPFAQGGMLVRPFHHAVSGPISAVLQLAAPPLLTFEHSGPLTDHIELAPHPLFPAGEAVTATLGLPGTMPWNSEINGPHILPAPGMRFEHFACQGSEPCVPGSF